tara:strand:- start:1206 stop:2195 length:990 start_codon:yes stop_codon:yes gene_type:complete
MTDEIPDDKTLRNVLSDIIKGYSRALLDGEEAYVKHFGNEDQHELEGFYDEVFAKAKSRGLPTEEESMDLLKSEGIWSDEDESEYSTAKISLQNFEDTRRNLIIPSQIEEVSKSIKEACVKMDAIAAKRQSLLTDTCESYTRNKSNDYSVYLSFYDSPECKNKFFSKSEFNELSKGELANWFGAYSLGINHLSIEHIKYLAISTVFSMYYNILGSKNLYRFINRPVYEFSFYQLNLLNYARVLNSILENVEKIPEKIKKDPDQLLAFADGKNKYKETVEKSQGKQGFSVMGATTKDMGEMGLKDELSLSPFDLAKDKGSLTIEDFQNLS